MTKDFHNKLRNRTDPARREWLTDPMRRGAGEEESLPKLVLRDRESGNVIIRPWSRSIFRIWLRLRRDTKQRKATTETTMVSPKNAA